MSIDGWSGGGMIFMPAGRVAITPFHAPPGEKRPRHAQGCLTNNLPNGSLFTMKLILDKLSRVVVPKPLRDRFALAPGDELEVLIEADGFRLRPVHPAPMLTETKGVLLCTSELPAVAWDLPAFLEKERDQRSRQVGGI